MKQISGNKLLVKALKEEGVEYIFGYPGACTIDISDELYKQDDITVILPAMNRHWFTQQMLMPVLQARLAFVLLQAVPVPRILSQDLPLQIMTVFRLYVSQDRLPVI